MSNKILNIGVIVAGIDEEYQFNIIEGINKFAQEYDANISYFTAFGGILGNKNYDIGEYNIFNLVNYKKFDGIVFMNNTISSPEIKADIIQKVKSANIPTVVFDSSKTPEFYNIAIDNFKAMEDIVKHIIEVHNATKINYVSGPMENPESLQRYEAYLSVLKSHNIEFEPERVHFGEFRAIDGREAAEKFVNSELEFPEAIICANDAMALSLINTLERYGITVPDDVLVTGFDNIYMARNFSPEITTVDRPLNQLGFKACDMIRRICRKEEIPKNHVVFTKPVFSESCGCKHKDVQTDIRKLKKENYSMIESCNFNVSLLNKMNSELADSESLEKNMNIINKYLEEVNCNNFYLCLCSNWSGQIGQHSNTDDGYSGGEYQINGYTEYMSVPLCREYKKMRKCDDFHVNEMMPVPFEDGGNIAFFLPVHFRERCLGYCIIVNSDFPLKNQLFHTWIMNMSNAFENVRKISLLNNAIDELDRLYVNDPLCNIYNRNGLVRKSDRILHEAIINHKKIMIMFIDMDGLKIINDTYSHKEGDFALKTLASILNDCCENGEICSRFGGDEFVIFTSDVTTETADELADKIRNKMSEVNKIINKPYEVGASLGYYITEATDEISLFNIITKADQKMYEEKKRKKTSRYLRHT